MHLHHIFPKSLLYKKGYGRRDVNALANFTFLTEETNLKVSNRNPAEYIAEYVTKQPGAIESHWIPKDPKLWEIKNYLDFLEARRKLLAQASNDFLDSLLTGMVPDMEPSYLSLDQAGGVATVQASDEEEKLLLQTNIWVSEQGLPEGEMNYELTHDDSGALIAILDLAWPEGIQEGYSQRVALLIDEASDVVASASQAGYLIYEDVDTLKEYVSATVLAA